MSSIQTIFWDLGGVLLTNAWDHTERSEALAKFKIDPTKFNSLHQKVVAAFENGEISLDEYLDRVVFTGPTSFSRDEFKRYMFSLSKPFSDRIQLARNLARSGKYFMGTINNESRELDLYRIETFGLKDVFSLFVSSCFVGLRKPEERIYRCALDLAQKAPEECCFIDDREENLAIPAKMGMRVIQAKTTAQIQTDLQEMGVGFGG